MDIEDNLDIEDESPPVAPVSSPGAGFSLVDAFKEELRELTEATTVFIPVKGYDKIGLQIKYHMPENGKELDLIARKINREVKDGYTRNLYIAMDMMIDLCEGIYVQPEGVEDPVMLDPDGTGVAATFDEYLATIMGMNGDVRSARAVVKRLFGGNEMAIIAHSERLNRWLQNTKADLDAELWQLGE